MRWIVAGLALALLVLGAVAGWIGWTESGLRTVLRIALPAGVSLDAARGRLVGPIELDGLHVALPAMTVDIARARLDWRPRALLERELRVEPLELDGVDVTSRSDTAEAKQPAGRFPPPAPPLAIDVRAIRVDGLRWQRDERELSFERLGLALRYDSEALQLQGLSAEGPLASGTGHARLDMRRPHPVTIELDWQLRPAEWPRIAGRTELRGPLAEIDFRQLVSEPFAARLEGRLQQLLQPDLLSWQAQLEVSALDPSQLDPRWPAAAAELTFSLAGTLHELEADGGIAPGAGPLERIGLSMAGRWSEQALSLDRLVLRHAESVIEASGELALGDGLRYRLDTRWQSLAWPLDETPVLASPSGRFAGAGDLQRYAGSLEAEIAARDGPLVPLTAQIDGDRSSVRLSALHTALLGGEIGGMAYVGWRDTPIFAGVLQARGLDSSQLAPHLTGRFDVDLRGNALVLDEALRYSIAVERLDGRLNGEPLAGQARIEGRPGRLAIADARLEAGRNVIVVEGSVDEHYDIAWDIEAGELGLLLPDAAGRLQSTGRLGGTRRAPILEGRIDMQDLRYQRYSIERGEGHAEVDLSGGAAEWRLELTGPAIGGQRFDRLEAAGTGVVDAHRVTARLETQRQQADLALSGSYAEQRWRGDIETLNVDTGELGRWSLQQPAGFDARPVTVELQRLCLGNGASSVCAGGSWALREPWQIDAVATDIELRRLGPWLPQGFDYSGTLSAEAGVRGAPAEVWTARAALRLAAVDVSQLIADERVSLLRIERGQLDVDVGAQQADARLELALGGEDALNGRLEIGRGPASEARIAGELRGAVSDLSLLPLLIPQVASATGELSVGLRIGGTRAEPDYGGRLEFARGRVHLIDLGLNIKDIELLVEGTEQGLSLNGRGRSGDGEINLEGQLGWSEPVGGELRLRGERFRVVSLPEARIDASPDLALRIEGRRLDLSGQVTVARARLDPAELGSAVRPSGDEIIVGSEETELRERGWQVNSRLQLELGEDVEIDAFGLKAGLIGRLRLTDRPDSVPTAAGELRTAGGTYRAYGQELEIERGRLVYNGGPLGNPGLDVRAVRRAEDVVVGLDIRGTLLRPDLKLFSEPALPQTQVMSYLLFGRPAGSLDESDQQLASQAASSVALKGGALLAKQLGRGIGLEDVSVGAEGSGADAALVLGKYLSPKLYVSYGIGLFESIDTFRIRYRLSQSWTLEAESGLEESADLLYTIER